MALGFKSSLVYMAHRVGTQASQSYAMLTAQCTCHTLLSIVSALAKLDIEYIDAFQFD